MVIYHGKKHHLKNQIHVVSIPARRILKPQKPGYFESGIHHCKGWNPLIALVLVGFGWSLGLVLRRLTCKKKGHGWALGRFIYNLHCPFRVLKE